MMKFAITVLAAFLIVDATALSISDHQGDLVTRQDTLENLERVRRGCSCGPYGCSCSLKDTDDSFLKAFLGNVETEDLKRSKRGGCFCGPNGCGCTLRDDADLFEDHSGVSDQSESLRRSKRGGCSCGPWGCSCSLKEEYTMSGDGECGPYGCTTGGGRCGLYGCTSK